MTDHKFTDDEIIHSLKVCSNDGDCSECLINPHKGNYGYCTSLAIKAALDLINRQKAKIKRLQSTLERAIYNGLKADEEIEYLKAEIERLKEEGNKYPCRVRMNENSIVRTKSLEDYDRLIGDISAEAIKEFAERLKSDLGRIPQYHFTRSEVEWSINTFVKEMTEEQKNESQST